MKSLLFCLSLFAGVAIAADAAVVVSGFLESPFQVPNTSQTTDIEFAPDTSRRLFIAQKDGTVRAMLQNGTVLPSPNISLGPLYTDSECGLIGMCFDPNFLVNHYVYFFVTVSVSEQQILRCQEMPDGSYTTMVLVRGLPTNGANHDGGGLVVGLDGKLYFSIGDLGAGVGVNGDATVMAAKVGRCNLDGTEVVFNPFFDGPGGNNDFIWARGFRNPFKLAVQPITGLIWVDDTGDTYEQIFSADKGDHGGWNNYENNQPAGFIKPRIKYRTNGTDVRQIADGGVLRHDNIIEFTTTTAHGFRKGERITVAGVLDPSFNGTFFVTSAPDALNFTVSQVGPHQVSTGGTATTAALGGAVTGGCFYNATGFPDSFRQNYFFCDYNSGRVNRATFDSTNEVATVDFFVSGINSAVDVTTGPNGHLYYTGFGSPIIYRLVSTNNPQRIVVSPQYLNMAEGGIAVVNVRLSSAPASNVVVDVMRTAGSPGISTTNLSLLFTPATFSDTQPIFIQAAADADHAHSQATFTMSCPSYATRQFFVNAYDPDHATLGFTGVWRTNNTTRFQVASEHKTRIALEASPDLLNWQAFTTNLSVSNVMILFDNSPVQAQRFYRARITR